MQANPPDAGDQGDEDFKPEERLFHYTSSFGLYGILDAGCLWATHFKFLNDSNEFFAARQSLTTFVEGELKKKLAALKVSGFPFKKEMSIADVAKQEAKNVVDVLYESTLRLSDPFIFSSFVSSPGQKYFRNGRLLHWATYGRDGGYALEINPHKLSNFFRGRKDNTISQRAVYVSEVAPPELLKQYEVIGKAGQEMLVSMLTGNWEGFNVDEAGKSFMTVASVIKNDFFENENEARLVALRLKKAEQGYIPPTVHVRHKNGSAIPYIKLFESQLLGEGCPIEAIIIGPHPDRERRKEALSIYLEAKGLKAIEIIQSEVPYLSQ